MRTTAIRSSACWMGIAIGLVLGLAMRADAAAAVRIVAPAGGERLAPGQLVEVRWEGLPDDADEMELLLEIDGGTPHEVRLTPQLIGTVRSLAWEVPNLPAGGAHLRLRWSRDGIEVEGEPSARFTILPHSGLPVDAIHLDCGEWWIGTGSPSGDRFGAIHGRIISGFGDHAIPGSISETTEVSSSGMRDRWRISLQPSHGLSGAGPIDPEKAARCPLTIPLRE